MGEGIEALQPGFAALTDVALAMCAGGLVLRAFMPVQLLARALSVGLAALAVGLIGGLWTEAASMSGAEGVAAWQAAPTVLAQTSFGHAALAAGMAWIIFLAAFAMRRRFPKWAYAAWGAFVVLCAARAASGHAMDGGWGSYGVWVHGLHIAAGSVWAGTVFVAAGLAPSWRHWAVPERLDCARHISQTATLALAAVAISGVVNTLRMLGGAEVSLRDPYTGLLAAKLACVALAVCLGGFNRWRVMPVLMEKGAAKRFAGVLLIEGAVLAAALLLAAELGATMPPM